MEKTIIDQGRKYYCYPYPMVSVATDCVVLMNDYKENKQYVLLIKRKNEPFKNMFAFPGGFVDQNETIEQAAKRELLEEAGLDLEIYDGPRIYDVPNRDPRGRIISVAYTFVVEELLNITAGDDAAEAKWVSFEPNFHPDDENLDNIKKYFSYDSNIELAFDHDKILFDCYYHLMP